MLITPKFNNDYASKVKYVYINNKKFGSSKFQYSLVKDTYKSSEEDVIKAVESNDPSFGFWSLIPVIIIIVFALWTKDTTTDRKSVV